MLREKFSFSTFKKFYESKTGTFCLIHSISDIPMTPSCSLRSFGIGGWCHVSCISIQILKFKVQAQGYAIRYVMAHNSGSPPPPTFLSCFAWSYRYLFKQGQATKMSPVLQASQPAIQPDQPASQPDQPASQPDQLLSWPGRQPASLASQPAPASHSCQPFLPAS